MVKKAVTYPVTVTSLPSLDPSSSAKSGGRVEPATKFSIPLVKKKKKQRNEVSSYGFPSAAALLFKCDSVPQAGLYPTDQMATHNQLASGQTLQAAMFKDRKKILSDASVFTIN